MFLSVIDNFEIIPQISLKNISIGIKSLKISHKSNKQKN